MCFNYKIGFEEPEPSNNLGDKFLIILAFDPSGMVRVSTLGRRANCPALTSRSSPEQGQSRISRESSHLVKNKGIAMSQLCL
jgi:hypothetical protein